MSDPQLISQSYGKSEVRLSRVTREGARHHFIETTVSIALDGDFSASYMAGDSTNVVATDTMKNTVYVLASRAGVHSIEQFAHALATHFLQTYPHVSSASITCEEKPWQRMEFASKEHDHAFLGGSSERFVCSLRQTADGKAELSSGLHGLEVLKTTGSEFKDFWRDEYTTLSDVDERIFATSITASWPCRDLAVDWTTARQQIRAALLDVFANQHSKSVQETLYEMARAAFAACAVIDEISIRMPNQHHLLANLSPFKLQNPNEVFVPTSAPYGDIRATIRRGEASPKQ